MVGTLGGYTLTQALLEDLYAQYVHIGPLTLLACAVFIFIIGMAASGLTIFKTAVSNPSSTLRSE